MGASSVNFVNQTSSTVNVAYMRANAPNCSDRCGSVWEVLGWIVLAPGGSQSRANPDSSRWFYFYAESADGRLVWNGAYRGEVQNNRFAECRGCILYQTRQNGEAQSFPIPPWHLVGYVELDTNTFGGVNLTEPV